MDKDILRIVIIVLGILVIAGMLLWNYFKYREDRTPSNIDYDDEFLDEIDDSLAIDTKDDDFDIIPLGGVNDQDDSDYSPENLDSPGDDIGQEFQTELNYHATKPQGEIKIPNILQFSIVTDNESVFSGKQLQEVFAKVGLIYGSNHVYERLDEYNQVDFAVASVIEPGIFPDEDFDSFTCPGIVFFFQPKLVSDALIVFDDLIETIHVISTDLGGIEWDQDRQPLTAETEKMIREYLLQEILSL
jgi:cell division protein ZipA